MKDQFCVLKIFEGTPLQVAFVRTRLTLGGQFYIEIDNTFFISCSTGFKDSFPKAIKNNGINYVLIYVDSKIGCDVSAEGINNEDKKSINSIVIG